MTAESPLKDLYDNEGKSRFLSSPIRVSCSFSIDKIIPPLWLGTPSDLNLINNEIRKDYPGNQDEYKQLEKSIRFSWGPHETPIYIVDHHQAALYCWYEAFAEGNIAPGATLLHFDDHSDAGIPLRNVPVITADRLTENDWTLTDVVETMKRTECWEFIEPAQRSGLIGEFMHVTPSNIPTIRVYSRNEHNTNRTEVSYAYYRNNLIQEEPQKKIVDIDLDFFASKQFNQSLEDEVIQTMREDIANAGVATFATSPGFIDPERAVALVKKILA